MPLDHLCTPRSPSLKRCIALIAVKPESGRASRSPARACALAVLRRVFEDGAWADRALHGEARRLGLDARERALAMRLAYGAVQRRATLDHVIETLAGRPVEQLEPLVLRRAAARRSTSSRTPTACPPTRRSASPSSSSSASRPAARSSSTPCCGAARARRPRCRRAARRHAGRRPRYALPPRVDRGAVVGRARPGRRRAR